MPDACVACDMRRLPRRPSFAPRHLLYRVGSSHRQDSRLPFLHAVLVGFLLLLRPWPQGKVALVTGGDSGIGRAVCYCFAQEGATVAFTYVKAQEFKDANDTLQMLRQIKKQDAKDPIAIPADLGYEENCRRVVDEVVYAYGRIDILVNNAAEQYERSCITDITEEQLERVFRTNIFSYMHVSK
ncbi:hypothetical protein B296_00049252 [Ensete ventricosum]|uniref:Uncharacterized protein n=1 Tax=Ensete ventricosum TaxID=4639 RepID=A0A426YRG6_ENSVE|nr:hypothetical protein B296_00049252 [Ensete ventricosum]